MYIQPQSKALSAFVLTRALTSAQHWSALHILWTCVNANSSWHLQLLQMMVMTMWLIDVSEMGVPTLSHPVAKLSRYYSLAISHQVDASACAGRAVHITTHTHTHTCRDRQTDGRTDTRRGCMRLFHIWCSKSLCSTAKWFFTLNLPRLGKQIKKKLSAQL